MKTIDPGQLDRLVSVYKTEYVRTDTGAEQEVQKIVLGAVWAKADDITGDEDAESGRVVTEQVRRYTLRYNPVLLSGLKNMYIDDLGSIYDIISVSELGRRKWIVFKTILRE